MKVYKIVRNSSCYGNLVVREDRYEKTVSRKFWPIRRGFNHWFDDCGWEFDLYGRCTNPLDEVKMKMQLLFLDDLSDVEKVALLKSVTSHDHIIALLNTINEDAGRFYKELSKKDNWLDAIDPLDITWTEVPLILQLMNQQKYLSGLSPQQLTRYLQDQFGLH